MYNEREKIKKEQKRIIGIEPVIDMKHFVILLLADLASKSHVYRLNNSDIKTAYLSADYKRIIEDIMYEENGWGIKFAQIINVCSYYEYQSDWEKKLGSTIRKVIKELNKEFVYDFENDKIKLEFNLEEIKAIKSNYDQETLAIMDHFSNLISDYTYSRKQNIDKKILQRSDARYMHKLTELSLRTMYQHNIKTAK